MALGVAAAFHGALFLLAGLFVLWGLLQREPVSLVESQPEMTAETLMLSIDPEVMAVPAVPIEEPKPKSEAVRYVRTNGSEPSDTPPEPGTAKFISDRNTKAASESAPDPNGNVNLPNQKGKDLATLDLETRKFATGEHAIDERVNTGVIDTPNPPTPNPTKQEPAEKPEMAKTTPTPEQPEPAKAPVTPPQEKETPPIADPASDLAANTPKDKPKELEMKQPKWEKLYPDEPKPKVAPQDQPKPPKPSQQAIGGSPGAPNARNQKAAMAETMKNEIKGGISNRGKASVEAADTPMGRYMAKVNTAVSQKFNPACMRARDRITYGTVQVEFDVNLKGGVENLRIANNGVSHAIMQDLVLGVILESKLPPIPDELQEYLIGNRLHISYGFLFH